MERNEKIIQKLGLEPLLLYVNDTNSKLGDNALINEGCMHY